MLKLLFFAQCADWMHRREMEMPLSLPTSIERLMGDPVFLPLRAKMGFLKVAVNRVMADAQAEVRAGDEIAFMPPFSGG